MEQVKTIAGYCAAGLELLGIGVIVLIALWSTGYVLVLLAKHQDKAQVYHAYRNQLVKGILLGLELLVAADIIHTVAINLTFTSVGVLAAIVVIRTFLSFTLELEMSGRWPWQAKEESRERR